MANARKQPTGERPDFMQAQAAEDRTRAQIEVFEDQFKRATEELAMHSRVALKDSDVMRRLAAIKASHDLAVEIQGSCARVLRCVVEPEVTG